MGSWNLIFTQDINPLKYLHFPDEKVQTTIAF